MDKKNTQRCIIWLNGWIENEVQKNNQSLSIALICIAELLASLNVQASTRFIPLASVPFADLPDDYEETRQALANKLISDMEGDLVQFSDPDQRRLDMQFWENFRRAFLMLKDQYKTDTRLT